MSSPQKTLIPHHGVTSMLAMNGSQKSLKVPFQPWHVPVGSMMVCQAGGNGNGGAAMSHAALPHVIIIRAVDREQCRYRHFNLTFNLSFPLMQQSQ